MKIGIISDAHLFHRKAISPEKYRDILINGFKDCDIIVDCGDLTDKSTLTSFQLEELYQVFKDVDKPVYLVAGNHDSLNNKSVTNILELKKNIKVLNNPTLITVENKRLLFIPYTNNIKSMYKEIGTILDGEPADCIFSHLNASNSFYSDIHPDIDSKKLAKYCQYWFNGHIHEDHIWWKDFFTFYNVGSCSSITYGDSHLPIYGIFDFEQINPQNYGIPIKGSLMHGTYRVTDEGQLDKIEDTINNLAFLNKIAVRFNIPCTNEGLELRQKIRDMFSNNDKVVEITFSYIKDTTKSDRKIKENKVELEKIPLIEQLINEFESNSGIKLDGTLRGMLL